MRQNSSAPNPWQHLQHHHPASHQYTVWVIHPKLLKRILSSASCSDVETTIRQNYPFHKLRSLGCVTEFARSPHVWSLRLQVRRISRPQLFWCGAGLGPVESVFHPFVERHTLKRDPDKVFWTACPAGFHRFSQNLSVHFDWNFHDEQTGNTAAQLSNRRYSTPPPPYHEFPA